MHVILSCCYDFGPFYEQGWFPSVGSVEQRGERKAQLKVFQLGCTEEYVRTTIMPADTVITPDFGRLVGTVALHQDCSAGPMRAGLSLVMG